MTNTQAELREKLAKAHYAEYMSGVQDLEPTWEKLPQEHRDRMVRAMSAALALLPPPPAVCELTDEMLCAGSDKLCFELGLPQVDHRGTILNVWKVMQDKALAALGEGGASPGL